MWVLEHSEYCRVGSCIFGYLDLKVVHRADLVLGFKGDGQGLGAGTNRKGICRRNTSRALVPAGDWRVLVLSALSLPFLAGNEGTQTTTLQ